ncbi:MAG TPA: 2-phospho-L-lactate transferase CofD family protein, partial [Clostridia bacterium]|nr:2-phospho-L-lactate transferase CofD family protein [Clostridia bacterium]
CDLTGSFADAIEKMGGLLNIRGKVLPVTLDRVVLGAKMVDGTVAYGQSLIPLRGGRIKEVFLDPPNCDPTEGVIAAIDDADIIVIGPGSLYTSIIPGLLVKGVTEAVRQSGALRLYICNIVTQPGETDGYTASDHVRGLHVHTGKIADFVLVNTAAVDKTLDNRLGEEILPVIPDLAEVVELGAKPAGFDFVDQNKFSCHHPNKLAKAIFDLYSAK